jgi:hypothetical protein
MLFSEDHTLGGCKWPYIFAYIVKLYDILKVHVCTILQTTYAVVTAYSVLCVPPLCACHVNVAINSFLTRLEGLVWAPSVRPKQWLSRLSGFRAYVHNMGSYVRNVDEAGFSRMLA